MLVIAHRGVHLEAPENTWAAFHRAVDIGCHRIELDVHMSADKRLVICHDPEDKENEDLPLLHDVVALLLDKIELNIELKGDNLEQARLAAELVAKNPLQHKVIFSCFELEPLQFLAKNFPKLRRACLFEEEDFIRHGDKTLDVIDQRMHAAQSTTIHPQIDSLLRENFLRHCQSRKWEVIPWVPMKNKETTQPEKTWKKLKEWGIAGLCTNNPKEMLAWIKKLA